MLRYLTEHFYFWNSICKLNHNNLTDTKFKCYENPNYTQEDRILSKKAIKA